MRQDPFFPTKIICNDGAFDYIDGITKREYVAIKILCSRIINELNLSNGINIRPIIRQSIEVADLFLEEINKEIKQKRLFYKGYWIETSDNPWKKFKAVHKDYDGNEDHRIFVEDTIEACRLAIEEFHDGKEYLPRPECKICDGSGHFQDKNDCNCWDWR